MEEKQIKDVEMATIYRLRLAFMKSGKKEFTVKEIGEFLDNFVMGKEPELDENGFTPEFAAELLRRVEDVKNGKFIEMDISDD